MKGGLANMRLPNNYGSITKLKGNRRRPYAVRKNAGKNEKGHTIWKCIGYAETYEEAIKILSRYNSDPRDPVIMKMTVSEVFERLLEHAAAIGKPAGSVSVWRSAYRKLPEHIIKMKYADLTIDMMQETVDAVSSTPARALHMRIMWHNMEKTALGLQLTRSNRAAALSVPEYKPACHDVVFTEEEIETLWKHSDEYCVAIVLIMIYMGWRRAELCNVRIEDIDFKNTTMSGGVKNHNSIRTIPIHHRIMPLVERIARETTDGYLVFLDGRDRKQVYRQFATMIWSPALNYIEPHSSRKAQLNHTPHSARRTMATRLSAANVSIELTMRIMGHRSATTTEKYYIKKTMEDMREAVEKLH